MTPARLRMGLLSAADRRLYLSLILLFKLVHRGTPAVLRDSLALVGTNGLRRGRSSRRIQFVLPVSPSAFMTRTFSYAVVRAWNHLPDEINREDCLATFKRKLSAYLATTSPDTRI